MCLWMPAAVLKTFPQFFHRHLNITFMEFCRKHGKTLRKQATSTMRYFLPSITTLWGAQRHSASPCPLISLFVCSEAGNWSSLRVTHQREVQSSCDFVCTNCRIVTCELQRLCQKLHSSCAQAKTKVLIFLSVGVRLYRGCLALACLPH